MNPIELLERMVAIDSPSRGEAELAAFLVEVMQGLGFEAEVDGAGNAVGTRSGPRTGGPPRELVLLGHMDTVPGDVPRRIQDGRLWGRGAVDAKGPLATFALAAAQVDLPENVRLVVIGAVEEETATSKGARQIAGDFAADYCVIGEPSSAGAITLGYKGRILINYSVEVAMGHSAGPERAAPQLAAEFWQRTLDDCLDFNVERPKLFDQLLPSLRSINSNNDGLTSTATCKIGVRLPPDFDIDGFNARLREFAGDASIDTYGYEPAHRSDRSNPLCRSLAAAIRTEGLKPAYKLKTGTADMNVVAPVWQCPILAYGPGDSSLDHTPNEHLHLDELVQAVRILATALNNLVKVAPCD